VASVCSLERRAESECWPGRGGSELTGMDRSPDLGSRLAVRSGSWTPWTSLPTSFRVVGRIPSPSGSLSTCIFGPKSRPWLKVGGSVRKWGHDEDRRQPPNDASPALAWGGGRITYCRIRPAAFLHNSRQSHARASHPAESHRALRSISMNRLENVGCSPDGTPVTTRQYRRFSHSASGRLMQGVRSSCEQTIPVTHRPPSASADR